MATPFTTLAERRHFIAEKYYDLATCVMILYDHSLTFDMEVENIWKQKLSFPKVLWFMFRYGAPLVQIGSVFGDLLHWTEHACLQWLWVRVISIQIFVIAVNTILILRIWALFEKARWTITVLLLALLGQTIVTIWSYGGLTATISLPAAVNGCLPVPKFPDRAGQVASIFIALLAVEAIIFFLSIVRIVKLASKGSPIPLFSVMLRDGIPYFFIICLVNLGNVLLFELPIVPTELKPLNTEITPVLIVIMVSRLFLNLRASENTSSDTGFTLVGNLGEPLQYDLGRIEIHVTMDHMTYTDDDAVVVGSVALQELHLGHHHSHQQRKSDWKHERKPEQC